MDATESLIETWQKKLFGVTDENFNILCDKYNISDRMLEDSVQLMKEWYRKQPHFPKRELSDRTLGRLISINKFSVEKTKKKLDNLYTARTIMPEFFANRDPWSSHMKTAIDAYDWAVIPTHTKEKNRINIMTVNDVDAASFTPSDAFSVSVMVGEIRMCLDLTLGDIYIMDLSNVKFSHTVRITPSLVKKMMFLIERCYGSRIVGLHMMFLPPYADFLLNATKSAIKKKVADRVYSHQSWEDLFKYVPREFIPKDMKGDFPKTSTELGAEMKKAIMSEDWRNWFLETSDFKSDESKRSVDDKNMVDDALGMTGTFRKLDID